MRDCHAYPSQPECTKGARRMIASRYHEQYLALQAARARQATAECAVEYAKRSGIAGTISQEVRACGLRRSRYRGSAKTHLGRVLTAVAINVLRIGRWLAEVPTARTRRAPFATLLASAM